MIISNIMLAQQGTLELYAREGVSTHRDHNL